MKQEFTCSGCGSKVLKYLSQLTRTDVVFCTLACKNKNFLRVTGGHSYNYLGPITRTCQQCHKTYQVERTKVNANKIFCSRACRSESQKGIIPIIMTPAIKEKLSQKQKEHCSTYRNQFLTGKSRGQHSDETISKISQNNLGKEPQWKGRIFQYDGQRVLLR